MIMSIRGLLEENEQGRLTKDQENIENKEIRKEQMIESRMVMLLEAYKRRMNSVDRQKTKKTLKTRKLETNR